MQELQSTDNTTASRAAQNKIQDRINDRIQREDREIEATVRALLKRSEDAIVGEIDSRPEEFLKHLHWILWHDPDRPRVLSAKNDDLAAKHKLAFRRMHADRVERNKRPDPEREHQVLAEVADALDYQESYIDPTQWAPVRLEVVDSHGVSEGFDGEDPTPIGRRRISHDDAVDLDEREVVIPHSSCDHIMAVALPRRGKDSTLASIGKNLKEEHGYSYVSILDDGRNETPMLAIPNDEEAIKDNLERMGQTPEGMDTEVFVPAMGNVPDKLPANWTPFTLGIDDLTPKLILRLAGITSSERTLEQRVKNALDKTLQHGGDVAELAHRLEHLAEETEVTVQWTEHHQETGQKGEVEGGSEEGTVNQATYTMEGSNALKDAAAQIVELAREGLIRSPDAATNVDIEAVIADQERAAVLCCNYLGMGNEALKYTIMDLWLRLIFQARDQNPRLPRVCVEIRELKNVAPSQPSNTEYWDAKRPLKQTIYFLSTQGGSRRVMMLGSTQKLNDVEKAIRQNMATKILLGLGEEEVDKLDRSYGFTDEQKQQLKEFNTGWGMVIAEGGKYYPIEFRGCPAGLGLGDEAWMDRYAEAWGARVRRRTNDGWGRKFADEDWWVHTYDNEVYSSDERYPNVGKLYSEWYLVQSDFDAVAGVDDADDLDPEDVTDDMVAKALRERRPDGVKSNLSIQPSDFEDRQMRRSFSVASDNDATDDDLVDQYDIPEAIRPWLDHRKSTLEKCVEVVRMMDKRADDHSFTTRDDLTEYISFTDSGSTLANHLTPENKLGPCLTKDGDEYALTEVGVEAAAVNWEAVKDHLYH